MKKVFKDLTIEEFVRVICDIPKKHTFKIQTFDLQNGKGLDDEREFITGDYWTLYRTFDVLSKSDDEHMRLSASRIIDDLEKSYFDYDVGFSTLDIYDYLDKKTKGFDREYCRMLIWDILAYKFHIIKDLDKCEINDERFFAFEEAINMLLDKIGTSKDKAHHDEQQSTTLPKELDTPKAKKVLDKAIAKGLISLNENIYQWHKKKSLFAYFCGRLFCGDSLSFEVGTDRPAYNKGTNLPEKAIQNIFLDRYGKKLSGLTDSRRQLNYAPFGYEIIDELFEEAAD